MMLVDLREGQPLSFRPFVLVGSPGCGKSRMVRRMAELLGAKLRRYDGAASADTPSAAHRRWSTSQPCFPLTAVAEAKVGNPIVMVDELDKATAAFFNGSLTQALMPFLEAETARVLPSIDGSIRHGWRHSQAANLPSLRRRGPAPIAASGSCRR
jgi:ATP-dependent Lon protease